ncbi:unnamed protein product [Alternaria burnsii]|nr:unnamed protein product [Alternaria burnsii]
MKMTEKTLVDSKCDTTSTNKETVKDAVEGHRANGAGGLEGGALHRYINTPSSVNFNFLMQCSWEASAVTFQFALSNGGPASVVYGSIFAWAGTILVALSLAEMSSMDPTVGAQYRWSATFAPKWNRFFGLMQGWITVFAWVCSCASNPALIANIVVGLASFNNQGYVSQRWHTTLIMCAATAIPFIGNLWLPRIINILETAGAICHVGFFLAGVITLLVMAQKSSTEYVFQTLTKDVSGWDNSAVAWGIGLITVTYPLCGFDSIIHMSDEVKQARTRVPRSIIFSVVVNGLMQLIYMITVLFTIGDAQRVSASPLPIIEVYYQATGSKAATNLFIFMLIYVIFVSFFNVFASVSRLIWAFSRDGGLPCSSALAKVHPTFGVPVNALYLSALCVCILALINVGSSTAFNAIISLTALGLYLSYFLPVLFLLWRRMSRTAPSPIPWGPFRLGIAGPYINTGALCYILFTFIWMPLPTVLPLDRFNMNYAGPILGAIILGAALDWSWNGKRRFRVPVASQGLE